MLGGLRRSLASQYDEPTLYLAYSEFNRQTSLSRWSHLPHLVCASNQTTRTCAGWPAIPPALD